MMKIFLVVLALVASFELASCVKDTGCLKGMYHKQEPGPSKEKYPECQPWQKNSCCTTRFTADLHANQTKHLYNHSWHACEKLSKKCEDFWIKQECFYQCSPYIVRYEDTKHRGAVKGVPVCSSVCDRWYEACVDDMTCVVNVFTDYNVSEHGHNSCPKGKKCKTYREVYGSGKALCEKMWGASYLYTKENQERNNCYLMWFDPNAPNPNKMAPKPSSAVVLRISNALVAFLMSITVLALI